MFNKLTTNLSKIFNKLRNSNFSKYEIEHTLISLEEVFIDADVPIEVIKSINDAVSEKLLDKKKYKTISSSDQVIKAVHDELIRVLGDSKEDCAIKLNSYKPTKILIVGLQGAGKTTFAAKIANFYKKLNKKILVVSLDVYRPAAREQLEILSKSIDVDSLEIISSEKDPVDIIKRSEKLISHSNYDIIIYDSAGRLNIDDEMTSEIINIQKYLNPTETLLTVDSLTGQSAMNISRHFHNNLSITGNLISKADSDTKGGAILSAKYITAVPIKFLGVGEKLNDIEIFDPKKIADTILDKGDILGIINKARSVISEKEISEAKDKFQKGIFTLNDYLSQMKNIKKIGGISSILNMLPGGASLKDKITKSKFNDDSFKKQEAIINSMTTKERDNIEILNYSRKTRVIKGSGSSMQDLNKLLTQFKKMSQMIKKTSKMNMQSLMSNSKDLFNMFK